MFPVFRMFEHLVSFCESKKNSIPLSFLVGFFVAAVVARWWQLFTLIPWLNKIAFLIQVLLLTDIMIFAELVLSYWQRKGKVNES